MASLKRTLNKIRHSLSLRLLLLFMAAAVVIIILFQATLGFIITKQIKTKVAPHAHQYLQYVQQDIGYPPNIEHAKTLVNTLPVEIKITGPDKNWASSTQLPDLEELHDYPHNSDDRQQVKVNFHEGQASIRIRQLVDQNGDKGLLNQANPKEVYEILIWTQFNDSRERRPVGLIIVLGIILAILGILYWLIRRLFRPIQTIRKSVQTISNGDLSQRIPNTSNDELGELATSINQMTDNIEQMLQAKRQLLLAISHELRSPITRAKVSTALLEPSDNQSNIDRDLREMEAMISELLEAERLNHENQSDKHQSLNKTDVTLNEIVMSVIDEQFLGDKVNVQLADELPLQQLDPTRLRLVTKNLLDNALKHQSAEGSLIQPNTEGSLKQKSAEGSPVILTTTVTADSVVLTIQDFGTGIAPEHLPLLTEPFYRADASRQRKTGGFGLGLYLVKLIVDAHGGELKIESELGKGTLVTVSLPIKG